ncbi:MAG: hypothetical protein AAGF12_21220 [Myxococcota bacterium]
MRFRFLDRPNSASVFRVDAPQANHGALIQGLRFEEQGTVLDAIERWIGYRPQIDNGFQATGAQLPPRLLLEGDTFLR